MASIDGWITEAAEKIVNDLVTSTVPVYDRDAYQTTEQLQSKVAHVRLLIKLHSPLNEGVAYMPVPRCDGCKHWKPYPTDVAGFCSIILAHHANFSLHIRTSADFGCVQWEAKP